MSSLWVYDTDDSEVVRVLSVLVYDPENYYRNLSLPDNVKTLVKVTEEDIPVDETFRDAWILVDGRIDVNYETIRAIIRKERNKSLAALDIKALAADRSNNQEVIASIEADAQALRDIPQSENFSLDDVAVLKQLYEDSKNTNLVE